MILTFNKLGKMPKRMFRLKIVDLVLSMWSFNIKAPLRQTPRGALGICLEPREKLRCRDKCESHLQRYDH